MMCMDPQLQALLSNRTAGHYHRQLMVLSGNESWCLQQAQLIVGYLSQSSSSPISCLSCNAECLDDPGIQHSDNQQYKKHLGREYNFVVFNAWRGFRASSIAALAGTIKSNGLMLLLCPQLPSWPAHQDPEWQQRISHGFRNSFNQSGFIAWLAQCIESSDGVIRVSDKGIQGSNAGIGSDRNSAPFAQQIVVIDQIKKVATGHRNRPLVITADRGRGKTAAMGIAAAQLISDSNKQILVTAPHQRSVATLFQHAFKHSANAGRNLRFVAVDELIAAQPVADLLLVDEAAAIPVEHLKKLAQKYHRIVFASTVNGYEGTGRGFALRFLPFLKSLRPELKQANLQHPIRWYQGDCLETFWWHCLHLKPLVAEEPAPLPADINQLVSLELIGKGQLLAEPGLLNQAFQLLVDAHYQTSPDDLVAMLDAPDHMLFTIKLGQSLVGVILASQEGQRIVPDLQTSITRGERRVLGHLLPQQLAFQASDVQFLKFRYLRIVRIAVHGHCRGKGIGRASLAQLYNWAEYNQYDVLGTSFGASRALVQFWQAAKFATCLLGSHKDKATAEFNAILVKPISNQVQQLVPRLQDELLRHIEFNSPQLYQSIGNPLLTLLLKELIPVVKPNLLSADEVHRLTIFAHHNRAFEQTGHLLKRLLYQANTFECLTTEQVALLLDFALKRQSMKQLVKVHRLSGKNQVVKELRQICAHCLT